MNGPSLTTKVWSIGGFAADAPDPGAAAAAHPEDVADFEKWLHQPPAPDAEGYSSSPGNLLRETVLSMQNMEHALGKTTRRAALTGDPVEGLEVQRELSDLYLSHSLAVKVISKTTQALDTLARLT